VGGRFRPVFRLFADNPNAGYTGAAAMAAQIQGESLEAMMRDRRFAALHVDDCGWPAATDTDQPWGHRSTAGDSLHPRQPGGHDTLGARTSGHSGSLGTFKTRAVIQPSRDLAVAVAANAGDAADAATSELRDALLERFGSPDE